MAESNKMYNNFASGELSPSVWGRVDRPFYATGCEVLRNFIPAVTGGASYRRGFQYVHHTRLNQKAFLITFKFNAAQSYTLEFTNGYMRVHQNGGVIIEAAKNVTGVTQATPGVVTSAGHGYSTGDEVFFDSIGGMTELNGQFYLINVLDINSFTIKDVDGNGIDTTVFSAYTSGGTVAKIHEVVSPYAEADLWEIKDAQTADVMYLVHPSYAPYKIIRAGHANWTLTTYVRTADPFTGADDYPAAVGFYGGRLWMGATNNDPDVVWGTMGPDPTSGQSRYDNFTVGTGDLDALIYTVTSQSSTVDRIVWFGGTPSFMVIGTTGGLYKANGGADGTAITPTDILVRPISGYGAADIRQVIIGSQTAYIQTGARTLRSFEFDFLSDAYFAFDKNLLAEDITYPTITQIAISQGRPDLIWAVRSDGVLLSCTFLSKEEVAGWARHYMGGDGLVLSAAAEPQDRAFDRLVICVERVINGSTRRFIEYQSIDPQIPDVADFYTTASARANDTLEYRNTVFELQKEFIRMDSALVLDNTQSTTLTLSALTGDSVTAVAGGAVFVAGDVGKYIYIKYLSGLETGVALITGFTNTSTVTVQVKQDFSALVVLTGGWYLTSSIVRGLGYLEGAEVGVITDGGVHSVQTVADGAITLDYPARYIIVGLKYLGYLRTLDLEMGADNTVAQGRIRSMVKLFLKFRNTMGGKYGSTASHLYDLESIGYRREGGDYTDRPPLLFTGLKELTNFDTWGVEKRLHITQDEGLPMDILGLVPIMDV